MSKVKLGDVAIESRETYKGDKSGLPIVGLEHIAPEEVTLSNWATDTENTFTKMFRKGDMLFGRRRAYLKKAAQAPFDGICSGDITVIRAKADKLLPDLLPFIIQNDDLFDFAVGKSAGSLSPRVKWENLKNYAFELPSLDEQKKVAEVLWSINDTIQAYQKLMVETDELVKSQFVEMFGGPVENPMGWPMMALGECLDSIGNGKSFVCENHSREGEFPAVLKLSSATTGTYQPDENKAVIDEDDFVDSAEVHDGDLLFTRKNTPELVGMAAYVFKTPPKLMIPDIIFRLNTNEKHCKKIYLWQLINHTMFRPCIQALANGSAKSMSNISKEKLMKLPIPVPDMSIQERFIDFFIQTDKSKFALRSSIASLQTTAHYLIADALGIGRKE